MIFTLFILTNCNTNCSTTAKYWKNMAFFMKTFQSYSFGDQQLTEPLIHKHIHSLIYFNNTLTTVMVYPLELISRGCSSHQFKLQKEHKSRMDTRLSSLSHQYEQPQCALDYYKNSIIARTLFTIGLQLHSGKSSTRNYSIYFAMLGNPCEIVHTSNFYVTVLFNVVK